jgi:ATP-binding cassette, subfamily B, bacterial MsbA
MIDVFPILRFGWPYLRRYWLRFALGIAFGFIFGLSNGATMGGVYLMLNRLNDPARVVALTEQGRKAREASALREAQESAMVHSLHATMKQVNAELYAAIDPWLPVANRTLDWRQLLGGLLFIPLLTAFRGLMGYATTYLMAWAGQRIINDVKQDVFVKINSLSLDFFNKHTTAELMSRINDDTGALNSCLRMGLSDLIKEPSTIFSLFIVLLLIDWKLTVIALAFLPLCVIPTRIISRKIKAQGRQDNIASVEQAGITMESFQNVRVTKAYELGHEHARRFRKAGSLAAYFILKTVQARATLNPIIETLNSFGISAIFIYAIWAKVSVQILGTFLASLFMFYTPFKKLSGIQVYFTQAGLAMERLMAIFRLEPTVRETEQPVAMPDFTRGIEFRDVSFSYGDHPVLEHISFTLLRGQRLGLVGESGSGKSSLINLLFRFHDPTDGEIVIDGTPIRSFRLADLRFHLALVSQDILLFNTTVAENIAFGKIGATREEVVVAAREAYAHDFISALPKGYDTPLGERGLRLSGGQRQRIAIARAFIRNAPILFLDEATASLDSQSEAEVQKAIDHLAENRTVVCVAHRLSTLRSMDKILVLNKGNVVERGSFEQLLAQRGAFTAMAARQSIFPQAA